MWVWGFIAKSTRGYWEYDSLFKLHCSNGYTVYKFTKIIKLHLKWLNFMVCKLYFNKAMKNSLSKKSEKKIKVLGDK